MIIRLLMILVFWLHASLTWAFENNTVDVNVHGVNYSENTFRFFVIDPETLDSSAGGELIGPFSAGGVTCCAILPKNWRPGTTVDVKTIHWSKEHGNRTRQEIHEVHRVEIPRYVAGKPGELWILRESNGKISVVSSDSQPNHPNWPGKIKGWPTPSLEYRREKWAISKKHEEDAVTAAAELLDELEKSPAVAAQKIWETEKEYDPKSIKGFAGASDPRYWAAVKRRIKQGLVQAKRRLQEIEEARP